MQVYIYASYIYIYGMYNVYCIWQVHDMPMPVYGVTMHMTCPYMGLPCTCT